MSITIFKGLGRRETVVRNDISVPTSRQQDTRTQIKEFVNDLTYAQMDSMYELNTWIRSCVDRIKERAVNVKPIVRAIVPKGKYEPTDKQREKMDKIRQLIIRPNDNKESFQNILRKVFYDILVYDAGAVEWVRDIKTKEIVEMYPVNGSSIKLNIDKHGMFLNKDEEAYHQVDSGRTKTIAKLALNELCYLMMNPRSKTGYGISPLETLVLTVTAELYAADFNIRRFKNDATPKIAVLVSGAGMQQGGAIIRRFQDYWHKELQGQPHKPIFLTTDTGNIELVKTGLTNEEMQYQQYSLYLLMKVLAVYKTPPFIAGIVDGSTGKLNSKQQDLVFKKDAIYPLLQTFSWHFNTEVIWSDDSYNYDDIYLHWDGIDIEDKQEQAKIHETYLRTGVYTINMVLNELGMDGVPWGHIPYIQKQYVPIGFHEEVGAANNAQKIIRGTESVEPVLVKEAITSLLERREKLLDRFWLIPDEVALRNVVTNREETDEN